MKMDHVYRWLYPPLPLSLHPIELRFDAKSLGDALKAHKTFKNSGVTNDSQMFICMFARVHESDPLHQHSMTK